VIAAASVLLLAAIVLAPWRRIRDEPPIDPADEARILLRRDPDEPTGEHPRIGGVPEPPPEPGEPTDFSSLSDLDDEH